MKFILYFFMFICPIFALVSTSYAPKDIAFQQGFEAGLKALEFQLKNEGATPREIVFEKPFLIALNIAKMSMVDVLYLQNISQAEGYQTLLTHDYLFFGEFDREADAKNFSDRINRNFEIRTVVRKNNKDKYATYPYLFDKAFDEWIKEVELMGYALKTETIYVRRTLEKPQKVVQRKQIASIPKIHLINPKAMAYIKEESKNPSKDILSEELKEYVLLDTKNDGWLFEKKVVTLEGEVFMKVKNENLYFAIDDVIIIQ
ncbi:hypothetical protein CCZ01_09360 [Helicobacter monodelphidis]|uniref:hypothetical protein n=1 Tax=Helicobacter sp. 15-1451 TaxID=2004995 RepID=UPI000DCC3A99|nr:hypothetical protein [Helicobacter sp. 15-1451]RAX56492.1 hypothetical protein CCZ01_09360 [Helicobacter sp. 15-1451]